jgi:hypothetical protein
VIKAVIGLLLSAHLTGCGWVERQVTNVEQRINKTKSCEQVSQREAPDYVSTKRYRCVGEDCHDYGCRQ